MGADFDGVTYDPKQDKARLAGQMNAVFKLFKDGKWRNLNEAKGALQFPTQAIGARLRDFRKPKFASFGVWMESKRVSGGTWAYRLVKVTREAHAEKVVSAAQAGRLPNRAKLRVAVAEIQMQFTTRRPSSEVQALLAWVESRLAKD
jgi:hypothetical protein